MNVIERIIEVARPADTVRLYFLTDWHVGSAYCDEALLEADIARVAADADGYWIGGGDFLDGIARQDKRHDEGTLAPWLWGVDDLIHAQLERVGDLMAPIAHKCLALAKGNHEEFILERYERDVYQRIVEKVTRPGAPVRLGYGGFVVLRVRSTGIHYTWTVTLFVHHGAGGSLLPGGNALTLGRLPTWYNADAFLLGHRHVRQVVTNAQWQPAPRAKEVIYRRQVMAFGGSYLKGYDPKIEAELYAEKKLLPPRETGGIVLELRPDEREVRVSL